MDTDYGEWSEGVCTQDGSGVEQLWREDRIDQLLSEESRVPLLVAGCTANQRKFYHCFNAVVLLSAASDVLRHRIRKRTTNDFGKDPAELARISQDLATG